MLYMVDMSKRKLKGVIRTPEEVEAMVVERVKKTPIKSLAKPIKQAIVKGLNNLEFSYRKITKVTGIDPTTVMEYVNSEIDDKWLQYSDAMDKVFKEKNDTLKILAANAMQAKLKDTDKNSLKDITGAYKVLNEAGGGKNDRGNGPQSVIAINVHPAFTGRKKTYNVGNTTVIEGEEVQGK